MPDAFIFDHVRTPRGRGKADGALHEVTALNLASQTLAALKERNAFDPALVDDVILGVAGDQTAIIDRSGGTAMVDPSQRAKVDDDTILRLKSVNNDERYGGVGAKAGSQVWDWQVSAANGYAGGVDLVWAA